MFKFSKNLRKVAASVLLTMGAVAASSSALAAPVFSVNPNTNGFTASGTNFQADALNGSSTARIVQDAVIPNQYTGTGYIQYTGFTLNGSAIGSNISYLNFSYGIYATFFQTFTCSGPLAIGVTCNVDSIALQLWGDVGMNDTFVQATLGADPTVSNTAGDVLLGTVNAVVGVAGIDFLGGAFQNVNTNFMLTAAGRDYFYSPDPFYTFAFSAFNNTSQGIACSPSCAGAISIVAITQESGVTDFNGRPIPEPGPLSLIGLGLFGIGFLRRKARAA